MSGNNNPFLQISLSIPRLGLATLGICLFSGIVLSFYYRRFGNVFQNMEEISSQIPFGWFFRNLHFASGQAFMILMLIHAGDHFVKRRFRSYPFQEWVSISLSVCVCLFILFTGFILKGDKEGFFAGNIFLNLTRAIPFVGDPVSALFIRPGRDLFFLPFLYHVLFLPCLFLYLTTKHTKEWLPRGKFLYVATVLLLAYSVFIPLPGDIPPGSQVEVVKGPWFFLGIQTLLKFLPPVWAGIIIPLVFWGLIIILPKLKGALSTVAYYFIPDFASMVNGCHVQSLF